MIDKIKISNKLDAALKTISVTGYGEVTLKIENNLVVFVVTIVKDLVK